MAGEWQKILQDEYGEGDEEPTYSDEFCGDDYMPDGMATIRLGGAEYSMFVANVFRGDLSLLELNEWSPEEAQRLSRLIGHLRTRRVVVKSENNIVEREAAARSSFLQALKRRETVIAATLRQHLQKGGVEEYL
jgi:hypothetical protein